MINGAFLKDLSYVEAISVFKFESELLNTNAQQYLEPDLGWAVPNLQN